MASRAWRAAAACAALSACGPAVLQDPDYFWFTIREGLVLGNYNSQGFTQAEVQGRCGWPV